MRHELKHWFSQFRRIFSWVCEQQETVRKWCAWFLHNLITQPSVNTLGLKSLGFGVSLVLDLNVWTPYDMKGTRVTPCRRPSPCRDSLPNPAPLCKFGEQIPFRRSFSIPSVCRSTGDLWSLVVDIHQMLKICHTDTCSKFRFLRTQIIQLASSSYAAWALTLHPRVGVENLAVFEVSVLIELDLFVVFFCFCGLSLIGFLWIKVSCLRIFCRLSSTFSFSSRLVQWILPIGRVSLFIYFRWICVFWMDDLRHFFGLKCLVLIRKYSALFCSHGVFPQCVQRCPSTAVDMVWENHWWHSQGAAGELLRSSSSCL